MNIYSSGSIIAGRYEVAGRPLLGGMGIVYLCMDHVEERPVALKTFLPEYLPDRNARDRFLREGTTWVDLGKHSNIVRCYNIDRIGDGRVVYLALEMIAKEQGRQDASLRSWLIPGQPLPVDQALLFALQMARGMKHATENIPGFVHRDLKPENVLVGADRLSNLETNRLRVTDFGLANILQASDMSDRVTPQDSEQSSADSSLSISRTQLTHGIIGTPLYMAPEQWMRGQLGIYTDVYALGCILLEMLAGKRAVLGDNLSELEKAHCEGQTQAIPTNMPETVRGLVKCCLRLKPGARYTDWGELETALGNVWKQINGRELPEAEASEQLEREERVAAGWSYSNMGASYLDIGKADVARGYLERAQVVGQAEGERRLEAAGLTHLGLAYDDLGNARRAIGFYEQALTISREIGDRGGESATLGNLGIAYKNLGDARRAIGFYEQRLKIAREIGDRSGEGATLGNLGNAYLNLGNARRAIGFYEQHLEISREIGDRGGEGNALSNLGSAYRNLGDARRAIGFHEQCLIIHREIGNRGGEGNALGSLGAAYLNLGDARRAIGFYEQALEISREIGDRRGEGATLGNLGAAYLNLGDARRAIGFYEQHLEISREIGYRHGEGIALGNLGIAYKNLGDARRAIGFYEQALEIRRAIGDRRGEGDDLGNLGVAYKNLGDVRRAIGFFKQQLEITREIGDRGGEGTGLCNLGNAYSQLGEVWRAIGFFEQAITICQQIGDLMGVATVSSNMALLYAQQGESQRALPLAQEAARTFTQIGSPNAQQAQNLVAQIQGGGSPDSAGQNPAQAAFAAFQQTSSAEEMRAAVTEYPFMADAQFIAAIDQFTTEQVPPEHKPAFQQRLAWLRQITKNSEL